MIQPEVKRKVISKNAANQITMMLESNVIKGHGKLAGVPGYRVAGKTGTAQTLDKETGKYRTDATIGSFAGFAPVENPKFVMLVVIDYPKDVQWAESTAAPVFGELAKFLLDYYGIEPTEDYTEQDMQKFNETHNYIDESKDQKAEVAAPATATQGANAADQSDSSSKKTARRKEKRQQEQMIGSTA